MSKRNKGRKNAAVDDWEDDGESITSKTSNASKESQKANVKAKAGKKSRNKNDLSDNEDNVTANVNSDDENNAKRGKKVKADEGVRKPAAAKVKKGKGKGNKKDDWSEDDKEIDLLANVDSEEESVILMANKKSNKKANKKPKRLEVNDDSDLSSDSDEILPGKKAKDTTNRHKKQESDTEDDEVMIKICSSGPAA